MNTKILTDALEEGLKEALRQAAHDAMRPEVTSLISKIAITSIDILRMDAGPEKDALIAETKAQLAAIGEAEKVTLSESAWDALKNGLGVAVATLGNLALKSIV